MTGKNLVISRFIKNIALTADTGIYFHGFAMLGFPPETEAEIISHNIPTAYILKIIQLLISKKCIHLLIILFN